MKLKDGFLLRELTDVFVVVPIGQAAIDLRGMITLNDSGAYLWKLLQTEQTERTLTAALTDEYDVDEARAALDVERFLQLLKDHDLLDQSTEETA